MYTLFSYVRLPPNFHEIPTYLVETAKNAKDVSLLSKIFLGISILLASLLTLCVMFKILPVVSQLLFLPTWDISALRHRMITPYIIPNIIEVWEGGAEPFAPPNSSKGDWLFYGLIIFLLPVYVVARSYI